MRAVFLAVFASGWTGWAAAQLPPPLERVIDGHAIPSEHVSVLVQPLTREEAALSHRADVPRNPASTIKVLTTWVALDMLGPTYSWPTEVYFLGDFSGGALDGDLALKGYGDPYFVTEELWKLLRALRRAGLEDVRGDLVIDDTYFEPVEEYPGDFDGQPFRTYNVAPNALLVNFKSVRFQFLPNYDTGTVSISADPAPSNLEIHNRLELVDGPCRGYQAGIAFDLTDFPRSRSAVFSGRFPAACAPYGLSRAVLEHDSFVYGVYRTLWAELGGRHRGGLRRDAVADTGEPALTWRSRPLAEIIRSVNKFSNNVMTRQLLFTLGAEHEGPPGSAAAGIAAIHDYLGAQGHDTASLVLDNGAGLSRKTRITAELLVDVLVAAARSPLAPEFLASLSLGGLDGTTRGRFHGHPATGRMHVKTGRLDDVSALAGYVHARSGVDYATVIMLNSPDAHRGPGDELQDALVRWVYELP